MSRQFFQTADARGTAIFSPQELDKIVTQTVAPQLDANHTMAVVAATNTDGVQAALLVRKQFLTGELSVEACWRHEWGDQNTIGAQVIWKW